MLRHISLPLGLLAIAIGFAACGGEDSSDEDGEGGIGGRAGSGGTGGNGGSANTTCAAVWAELATYYADAGQVGMCESERGALIASSLMNLVGLEIDNNGEVMNPCVEVQCDADYAYIVSNDLPHYDFVQTTPNALAEDIQVYRIPLTPSAPSATGATDIASMTGCQDAYDAFFRGQAPNTEPAGFCTATQNGATLTESLESGQAVYSRILCLGSIGATISGVNVNGPNEATMPDPSRRRRARHAVECRPKRGPAPRRGGARRVRALSSPRVRKHKPRRAHRAEAWLGGVESPRGDDRGALAARERMKRVRSGVAGALKRR